MITLADSLTLAYTKIRMRRLRLLVVLLVGSLVFGILVAGTLVVNGALRSFESFSSQGYSGRYIVRGGYTDTSSIALASNPDFIARVEALDKDMTTRKKAEAKRLGIEYQVDEANQAIFVDQDGTKSVNLGTDISLQAYKEMVADRPSVGLERFKKELSGAAAYYEGRHMALAGGSANAPRLSIIDNGKEDIESLNQPSFGEMPGMQRGIKGVVKDWSVMSAPLLTPYVLKGQDLAIGADGSIPIIASYSGAQEILTLPALDSKATNQQKKQRLETVRQQIGGKTFQVCYRNITSATDLRNAIQQQSTEKANQTKKDYQKPSLIYAPSSAPCQAPVVQRDVRGVDEKKLADKQAEFDKKFGKLDPAARLLTFRIVGINQDGMSYESMTLAGVLQSMLLSSSATSWTSPIDILEKIPETNDIFATETTMMPGNPMSPSLAYYAEYDDPARARSIMANHNCVTRFPFDITPLEDGAVECSRESRPFELVSFGSASLAIDDFKQNFQKIQLIVATIIAVIASLILMGMIGRIIADGRKETAVFRALGASRLAIAQIYLTYAVYLALLVIGLSLLLGLSVALWVESQYGTETALAMALLFNVSDLNQPFHFYGLDWYDVGLIAAVIVGSTLLAALLPIASNVGRNPIRDMREE